MTTPKEYIEREAAIKELCQVFAPTPSESYIVEKCIDKIVQMSAADVVEVVHGRWEWDEHAIDWGLGGWVCGECKSINDNIPTTPEINPHAWVGSNYCPNCGAKMDGDNNAD